MKYLLALLLSLIYCQCVNADPILQSIEDSQIVEIHNIILDKQGRVRDMVNKQETYFYLNNQGERESRPYKVKCLIDNRPFGKKMPTPLKVMILVMQHIQIVIPL